MQLFCKSTLISRRYNVSDVLITFANVRDNYDRWYIIKTRITVLQREDQMIVSRHFLYVCNFFIILLILLIKTLTF